MLVVALDFKTNHVESQGLPQLTGLTLTEADGWGGKGEDGDSRLLIFPSLLGRGVWDFGSVVQGSANRSRHRVTKRMNE